MPLHLIRSITESISEYSYDFKTDVWIFGDRKGLAGFAADLNRARSATEPIHVAAIPNSSPGMRCVILPAVKISTTSPVLKVVERIVFFRKALAMQVVLCGNRRGFAKLAAIAQKTMLTSGGPTDHWHCDDSVDDWLLKRSISLNFRGVVPGWKKTDLDCYYEDLQTGGKWRLPYDVAWLQESPEYSYKHFPSDFFQQMSFPRQK